MSEIIRVDAMGDTCPIPVVKAKKQLDHVAEGTVVEVHVDNEIAVQNLIKLAKSQRCACKSEKLEDRHFVVSMWMDEDGAGDGSHIVSAPSQEGAGLEKTVPEKTAPEGDVTAGNPEKNKKQAEYCRPDARTRQIVVIGSGTMGGGNDSLGTVLMKGFLYALSQMDILPEQILFYNGGVKWTTEESEVLDDLKSMEAQGVEILSCGTCLDYYRCTDKLMVGQVTNMYSIVEAMMQADKIIRP